MPISDWIYRNALPEDYYVLLGRRRFEPGTEALKGEVRRASRDLMAIQNNHQSKEVRTRADLLMKELTQASRTFEDDARRAEYDRALAERLLARFRPGPGYDSVRLGDWLLEEQSVHPDAVASLLELARGGGTDVVFGSGPRSTRPTGTLPPIDLGTEWEEISGDPDGSDDRTLRDDRMELVELTDYEEGQEERAVDPAAENRKFLLILIGIAVVSAALGLMVVNAFSGGSQEEAVPVVPSSAWNGPDVGGGAAPGVAGIGSGDLTRGGEVEEGPPPLDYDVVEPGAARWS